MEFSRIAVASVFIVLLGGVYQPVAIAEKPEVKISGTVEERIHAIADIVTGEAKGLLVIPYAEAPEHSAGKTIHYGVHYNVYILRWYKGWTDADEAATSALIARLISLTAKHVLAKEANFSHMGVQVFGPAVWSFGGHQRNIIPIFEFGKEKLLKVPEGAAPEQWFNAGTFYKQILVPIQ